jgi:hypothetical protein
MSSKSGGIEAAIAIPQLITRPPAAPPLASFETGDVTDLAEAQKRRRESMGPKALVGGSLPMSTA